jgi:hypothetical protein
MTRTALGGREPLGWAVLTLAAQFRKVRSSCHRTRGDGRCDGPRSTLFSRLPFAASCELADAADHTGVDAADHTGVVPVTSGSFFPQQS